MTFFTVLKRPKKGLVSFLKVLVIAGGDFPRHVDTVALLLE
jgi:hypothetical protein